MIPCPSQWPRDLRRMSTAARLLRSWVRIPPATWISVCCDCCVLSGRGLCDELTTRPEESYRLWCVAVCDIETSSMISETSINCDWTLNRRYITGYISCMPLIVSVDTGAECPRTDCNIYWEKKKWMWDGRQKSLQVLPKPPMRRYWSCGLSHVTCTHRVTYPWPTIIRL
jgi:hypothetical protein